MTTSHVILDGVILSTTINNGDGTGTCTYFTSDGAVERVEELTDLPVPILDQEARIIALQAQVDELTAIIAGE